MLIFNSSIVSGGQGGRAAQPGRSHESGAPILIRGAHEGRPTRFDQTIQLATTADLLIPLKSPWPLFGCPAQRRHGRPLWSLSSCPPCGRPFTPTTPQTPFSKPLDLVKDSGGKKDQDFQLNFTLASKLIPPPSQNRSPHPFPKILPTLGP